MKVTLNRMNQAVHFRASSTEGHTVDIDGGETSDGADQGVRPMQLVLMAAGGCSSIDIHLLLKKMRQPMEDLRIEVEAERVDEIPAVFKKIFFHYHFKGELKEDKVRKSIEMSLDKHCSVVKMLDHKLAIGYDFSINGKLFKK
jgi:Predicted redox protein, regulator of disulfide bond formation